jgi:protein phosphatase
MLADPIEVRIGSCTDRGHTRAVNEDSFLAERPLFVVADGRGGHEAGEVASAIAVDAFRHLIGRRSVDAREIWASLASAQLSIDQLAQGSARGRAGTTVTGVAITEIETHGYWLVFNLGDSRTYRLAGGTLEQVSVDHSVVQELVEAGEIEAASAPTHPQRNVITRALGAGNSEQPDFWLLPAERGDRILVCSDGLTGELADVDITRILLEEADPQTAAMRLVRDALAHGGRDNLTVLVIDAVTVSDAAGSESENTRPAFVQAGYVDDSLDDDDTRPSQREG